MNQYIRVRTLVEKVRMSGRNGWCGCQRVFFRPACEVELWDENQYPVDVVTFLFSELEVVEE